LYPWLAAPGKAVAAFPGARPYDSVTSANCHIMKFRHKALAALLAAAGGALGLNRAYLGQRGWWLPLGITVVCLPWLIGVKNWYQTPAFFVLMIPVVAGFIQALFIALIPDAQFDARFNVGADRRNRSGWDAVLIAVASLALGAIVLMTAIALLFQTWFEASP
jgi:hypothetical protein